MALTLSDAKNSRISVAINIAPTDPRFIHYLNEAVERLIPLGHWQGTTGRYRIQVNSTALTLPPQLVTLEGIAMNGTPLPLRDRVYEFVGAGPGPQADSDYTLDQVIERGTACVFADIVGTDKKLNVMCDVDLDVGKEIRLLGYDADGNWIRTKVSGAYVDGEPVLLSTTPGITSSNIFSAITGIQCPSTLEGQWWLSEVSTVDGSARIIGRYQYWETLPEYKRYLIPFSGTDASTVECIGKHRFIPVKADTDYLIVGSRGALKLACMALRAEDDHLFSEANLMWARAVAILDAELGHATGAGVRTIMQVINTGGDNEPLPLLIQ